MKTINTQDAEGSELDYLVCLALGFKVREDAMLSGSMYYGWWVSGFVKNNPNKWTRLKQLRFHESIYLLWPVIESAYINIQHRAGVEDYMARLARAKPMPMEDPTTLWYAPATGSTRLQAAARCFAKSVLGETADVPEELA